MSHSLKTGNRYAQDYGGNHIEAIRNKSSGLGVWLQFNERWCTSCKKKKPTKGGTKPNKFWMCKDCKTSKVLTP